MTAPQSLSGVFTVVTDEAFPAPPSIERQEEVLALWRRFCTSDPKRLSIFWWFIRALDAQHAERTRAEVEKTREAAILEIQAEAAATEDGETLESLNRVIERLRAVTSSTSDPSPK